MRTISSISTDLTRPYTTELGADGGRTGGSYSRQAYKSLDHVLELMKDQINKFKGDSDVRQHAFKITKGIDKDARTGMADRRNFGAIADKVYDWINKNIAYVRDPAGIEYLQSPLKTIEYGFGDCDDHTILAGALLSSMGVPVQLKVIKANPEQKDLYSHIYLVYLDRGEWKPFDTTLHTQAGHELAGQFIYGEKFIDLAGIGSLADCGCKHSPTASLKKRTGFLAGHNNSNHDLGFFGHSGKERRSEKRSKLSEMGFEWVRSSQSSDRDWNIGAWDDAALNNIFAATQKYGPIVVKIHNQRMLTKSRAQSQNTLFSNIETIIARNTAESKPAPQPDQQVTQAGFGNSLTSNPVYLIAGGLALAGTAFFTVKNLKN